RTARAIAAIAERNPATCHALRAVLLMTAPPVEKRTAAASTSSRAAVSGARTCRAGVPAALVRCASALGVFPVVADTDVHRQRDDERRGVLHALANQFRGLGRAPARW